MTSTELASRQIPSAAKARPPRLLIDSSLSIVNRTGAYFIAKDICQQFAPQAELRYWRLGSRPPEGLFRKIGARLMMAEIGALGDSERLVMRDGISSDGFRLFLDPLYVLRSELSANDIVLCHDVGPLTHPSLYDPRTVNSYRRAYDKIARVRPGMVFVSEWSRDAFVALHPQPFRFLHTIPLYVRTELFNGPAQPVAGLDKPFLLTVGAFETRKNQVAALKAFRDGGFHHRGIRYVLCGSRGAGHEEIIALAATIAGVDILNYVPDAQLRWLYANAEAFVLPSLLEGFGMPALEAAHMGLLPIVSAGSALVEAVEGICLEIPPDDPIAIAKVIEGALTRTSTEKAKTADRLVQMAASATKERFLAAWRDLIAAQAPGPANA